MGLGGIQLDEDLIQIIAMIIKIAAVVFISINIPPIMIWVERRAPALMQRRRGPNRVGVFKFRLWGLLQSAADAIKLIFKEEARPSSANFFYHLGPVFGLFPALLVVAAISFGNDLDILGVAVPLQIIRVNVGFLFILALSGMAIYGIILAGWSSNNKFSLLGSLRASAQMVSYEIPMGLSLIPLVLLYDTLDLHTMVLGQASFFHWGVFLAPLSFVIFLITMFAETNRLPFDLAEGESELVAGFHTEYGSTKFASFFLAEYVNMFALSCLVSIFFFGGWQIPFLPYDRLLELVGNKNIASLIGLVCLMLKAGFFLWLFVWVRWTIPRFRYDQLMKLGWKFLLPLGLANVLITAMVLAIKF